MSEVQIPIVPGRADRVQQAIRLEYFTIIYNITEGLVSVVLGGVANSISLSSMRVSAAGDPLSWQDRLRRSVENTTSETTFL